VGAVQALHGDQRDVVAEGTVRPFQQCADQVVGSLGQRRVGEGVLRGGKDREELPGAVVAGLEEAMGVEEHLLAGGERDTGRLRYAPEAEWWLPVGDGECCHVSPVDPQRVGMPGAQQEHPPGPVDLGDDRGEEVLALPAVERGDLAVECRDQLCGASSRPARARKQPRTRLASRTASRPLPRTSPTSSRTPHGLSSTS